MAHMRADRKQTDISRPTNYYIKLSQTDIFLKRRLNQYRIGRISKQQCWTNWSLLSHWRSFTPFLVTLISSHASTNRQNVPSLQSPTTCKITHKLN